jgi:hypothetical protein
VTTSHVFDLEVDNLPGIALSVVPGLTLIGTAPENASVLHSKFGAFRCRRNGAAMSEERLDRDGLLKLAERNTQIEVGTDGAAPVVDYDEHDAQTCPVCSQVADEITALSTRWRWHPSRRRRRSQRTRCARLSTNR